MELSKSSGSSSRLKKKTDLTFVSNILSHPASIYSAIEPPQAAPALFTRICRRCSRAATCLAKAAQPAAGESSARCPAILLPRNFAY